MPAAVENEQISQTLGSAKSVSKPTSDQSLIESASITFFHQWGFKYYAFLLNVFMYIGGFELTGSIEVVFLIVLLAPNIGALLPDDDQPEDPFSKHINKSILHMFSPITFIICQYIVLGYTWVNYEAIVGDSWQSFFSGIGALTYTLVQNIDGCHELMHRPEAWMRYIAYLGLIPYQFTTYPIQHIYMHHKYVGSERDAVTSPKNMSIYRYYVKTIFSSYVENFKYSKLIFALCVGVNISYVFGLYKFALNEYSDNEAQGLRKFAFFLGFAYYSLFIMQCVEYLEHYGLVYRKPGDGQPVDNICSWNTTQNQLMNWITFRFQRHSDHHVNAYKIFSTLDLTESMPRLPFNFMMGIMLTWFTPVFTRVMNPMVDKVLKREKVTKEDTQRCLNYITPLVGLMTVIFSVNAYTGYYGIDLTKHLL